MRDKIKDKQYFEKVLKKEKADIEMFENIVQKSLQEKGESNRGTRNGYSILINLYQNIINLFYSYGTDLSIIEGYYKKLLFYYSKMWNRKYGYIELIKVFSLAVLFSIKKDDIIVLEKKIINEKFNDFILNVMINKLDTSWENQGLGFEFPGIYECLKKILNSNEPENINLLKYYLQNQWYRIHKECSWFDSHLSENDNYYGYWSFEAGAAVKILGIDDSGLKDIPYYPYDLVHYKE